MRPLERAVRQAGKTVDLLRRRLVWVFSLDLLSEKLREAGCDDAEIGLYHGHVADDD
jgi:hypothetical protein